MMQIGRDGSQFDAVPQPGRNTRQTTYSAVPVDRR